MASYSRRVSEGMAGAFFVDDSCIDCDTCRWLAPATFAAAEDHAFVARQPDAAAEVQRALMALVACPTGSIGTTEAIDCAEARDAFPEPIAENVFHVGFHAEASFGAASYLVRRGPGANVLVDSPRFARPLVRRLEELGGVAWMFLTHRDDVADHRKFRDHFGCARILHHDDVTASTRDVEWVLDGADPIALDEELLAIPVPGHTRGSACLLHRKTFLFSGDHLAWSDEDERLVAFRDACWFDWARQRESMERLAQHRFEWVLPGHGRRHWMPAVQMSSAVSECVAWMGG